MKKTYTVKEVAKIVGCHPNTIFKKINQGILKAKSDCIGGKYRISEKNLQEYLNKIA